MLVLEAWEFPALFGVRQIEPVLTEQARVSCNSEESGHALPAVECSVRLHDPFRASLLDAAKCPWRTVTAGCSVRGEAASEHPLLYLVHQGTDRRRRVGKQQRRHVAVFSD